MSQLGASAGQLPRQEYYPISLVGADKRRWGEQSPEPLISAFKAAVRGVRYRSQTAVGPLFSWRLPPTSR